MRPPRPINFSELYTALQTKIVDGQENPLTLLEIGEVFRGAEVLLAHQPHVGRLLVPGQPPRLGQAAPDVREVAARNLDAAALEQRAMLAEQAKTVRGKLESFGMVFNTPESATFRDVLNKSGFYGEWKSKFGADAWALLEKYSGKLG